MNVGLDDGAVYVTLSRRNLLELIAELDDIKAGDGDYHAVLSRSCNIAEYGADELIFLRIEAQEDDVHYGDRTPGTWGMVNP